MKRVQAYQYELIPNGEQKRNMRRFAGSCRYVYNKALAVKKEAYEKEGKTIGYYGPEGTAKLLTKWRNDPETQWLSEIPNHPLQQKLMDLQRAYTNFFKKRAQFPRFRAKGVSDSFRFPTRTQFTIDQPNSRIKLSKLGWIRYRNSREILGTAKNITISIKADKFYASIQTERDVEDPVAEATTATGIDRGITRFATLSDGTFYSPLNSFRTHQKTMAKLQRAMSRKKKFSSNWKKTKAKVTKLHIKIGNCRNDYLHKTSTEISQNHRTVFIEDLKVVNMSSSAKGTIEKPGRNVKAKSGLNKSILDQGWGEFNRQLTYKLEWNGGRLETVPPEYTSQRCPSCNHVSQENRKTQATFRCVECDYKENADTVAALNIERAGRAQLA